MHGRGGHHVLIGNIHIFGAKLEQQWFASSLTLCLICLHPYRSSCAQQLLHFGVCTLYLVLQGFQLVLNAAKQLKFKFQHGMLIKPDELILLLWCLAITSNTKYHTTLKIRTNEAKGVDRADCWHFLLLTTQQTVHRFSPAELQRNFCFRDFCRRSLNACFAEG